MQILFRILDVIRTWAKRNVGREPVDVPYLWKPDKILAEIRADNEFLKIGKYLHLEQTLEPGEQGWTTSKIQIPDKWIVVKVGFEGDQLVLETKEHGKFQLNRFNEGPLSYDVLCAGKNNYSKLESIWNQHARAQG